MSTAWLSDDIKEPMLRLSATGFPGPSHPSEPDLFCRQAAMPGHDQAALENAHVVVVGCGGLGSWIALGLARMGCRHLTLIDPDIFDRSNIPRQLMKPTDIGRPKAHALAENILSHMANAGVVTGVARQFKDAIGLIEKKVSAIVVGVDNNAGRLAACRAGRAKAIPVVLAMLSADGLRAQSFLQGAKGPCLSCVLPNLEPDNRAPCAAASVASCMLAAAHSLELCVAVLSGDDVIPPWRETSLDGTTERVGRPLQRADCACCQRGGAPLG